MLGIWILLCLLKDVDVVIEFKDVQRQLMVALDDACKFVRIAG